MAEFSKTIGFIGAGRMATALARGCVQSKLVPVARLLAADPVPASRQAFSQEIAGAEVGESNELVLGRADIVVLAVKPQMMATVLSEIQSLVTGKHLLVSIAAGIPLARLAQALPAGTRLIRVMPNTPCLIGEGASCFSRGPTATAEDSQCVRQILASVGIAHEVPEHLLDAVTGLSGSGPAFLYRVIESMAEGGVVMGIPPELALELAAKTALGAAKMVLSTGKSPVELREQVTSPGGTTVAGLETLARLHGAEAFREAVVSATKRSAELGRG